MRGGRVSSSSQGLAHWTTAAAVKSGTLPPPPYAPDYLLQCRLHAVSLCPAGLCLGVQHCNLRLALPPQPRLVSGAAPDDAWKVSTSTLPSMTFFAKVETMCQVRGTLEQ